MLRICLAIIAATVLGGCFHPAAIDNRNRARWRAEMEGDVRNRLQTVHAEMQRRGWQRVGEPVEGTLEPRYDEEDDVRFTLTAGRRYAVILVCDKHCSDSDLYVYDPQNRRVAVDEAPSAGAVVEMRATTSGQYRARVTAPTCRPSMPENALDYRCWYGLAVYTQ